jgi:predicted metal-binding membrane protein
MARAAQWPEAWHVVLGLICLVAWALLARDSSSSLTLLAGLCSASSLRAIPLSLSFELALAFNIPAHIASGWALMVLAMMPPLIIASLRHVRDRSFARRRERSTLLFVAGCSVVWMTAGFVPQVVSFTAVSMVPVPMLSFGIAVVVALLWQVSPAKQWFLNRCHRRPHLAAFGAAADRDAFAFGLMQGASCLGSCWALMLAMLVMSQAHILGMLTIALFAFGERFEGPSALAWRWRGPTKALRIVAAQARLRLYGLQNLWHYQRDTRHCGAWFRLLIQPRHQAEQRAERIADGVTRQLVASPHRV